MSNFFLGDRIKESSRTQGTQDIILDGAVIGFSSFEDFYASGDTVFYAITDNKLYEVGSGIYKPNASHRSITRNPFRSSSINVGPWYVDGTSNSGPTDGTNGLFYPLWLSRSAAISGVGFSDGPYTSVSGVSFDEYPGQTFYYATEHAALGVASQAGSGSDFNAASQPVGFEAGVKEVFVTYPGKTAVYQGFGLEPDTNEPKKSGIAFWVNEQILNYNSNIVIDNENSYVGVGQTSPDYAIDVAGGMDNTGAVRASGFVDGGSGVMFSGGQLTDTFLTASGGRQLEPFRRNRITTSSTEVIRLSGLVDEIIDFRDQPVATFFAGPVSGACDPCPDEYPTFRQLFISDLPLPDDFQDYLGFIVQDNVGLDGVSANTDDDGFVNGMVAIYGGSGIVTYDSGIYFNPTTNSLLINGNANDSIVNYNLQIENGDLYVESGTVRQLLFPDSNYRIGKLTGNGAYNTEQRLNFHNVFIGENAGQGASGNFEGVFLGKLAGYVQDNVSGVVAIGSRALASGTHLDNSIFIGPNVGMLGSGLDNSVALGINSAATSRISDSVVSVGENSGSGTREVTSAVFIGKGAGVSSSGITKIVALGEDVLKGSSGIVNGFFGGEGAASGSLDFSNTIAVGDLVAVESSGFSRVISIGQAAARYGQDLGDVIAIGRFAAQSGLELDRTVSIGALAGSNTSGNFNIYIGQDAGIAVSGSNNIEIIASGENTSFLTHEASGKINVGNIIAGDIYESRVGIGDLDNASPSGTLFIRPRNADEPAFVLQHKGSGSATPYMVLQSGDGTTIYQITNSGDVISSGFMNPSGGLKLNDHVPDSIVNKLYNDGGTLKWNGSTVDTGAGTSWYLSTDETGASVGSNITTDQTVTISGVSGVEVQREGRYIRISASGLSGVLQNQIVANSYSLAVVASGEQGELNNEVISLNKLSTVNPIFAVSGISGVNIDVIQRTDGINNSGIFVVGYDPDTTYSFFASASGEGEGNNGPFEFVNNSRFIVSGVSGVSLDFFSLTDGLNNSGIFKIGAAELSGQLRDEYYASGNYYNSQILENTTSGVAISGIAVWASGEFDRLDLSGFTGDSGILVENSTIVTNPVGSGRFATLTLNNGKNGPSGDSIFITTSPSGNKTSLADPRSYISNRSVAIGSYASQGAQQSFNSVSLGSTAGMGVETSRGDSYFDTNNVDTYKFQFPFDTTLDTNTKNGIIPSTFCDGKGVAVGVWSSSQSPSDVGEVRIYQYDEENGFILHQTISSPIQSSYTYFGYAIDVSEDGLSMIVGAPEPVGSTNGFFVIYSRSSVNEQFTSVLTVNGASLDQLGSDVACSSNGRFFAAHDQGTDFDVYRKSTTSAGDTYTQVTLNITSSYTQTIRPSLKFSADGKILVMGIPSILSGKVLILRYNEADGQYYEIQYLDDPDPADSNLWGQTIALSDDGSILCVAAPKWDENLTDAGGVHVYKFNEESAQYELVAQWFPTAVDLENASLGINSLSCNSDASIIVLGGLTGFAVITYDPENVETGNIGYRTLESYGSTYFLAGAQRAVINRTGDTIFLGNAGTSTNSSINYRLIASKLKGGLLGHNTSIGSSASVASYHKNNIDIGFNAGANSREAIDCISLGTAAGIGASYNDSAISIGAKSGAGSKVMHSGIMIGESAGAMASSGDSAIFIGSKAGYRSKTSDNIIAIGHGAGYSSSLSAGRDNQRSVSIGLDAGKDSDNSNLSVFIGEEAGYRASGVQNCVAIGQRAGRDAGAIGAITDANAGWNNTVAIGQQAGYLASGHHVDSVYIGVEAGKNRGNAGVDVADNRNSVLILPDYDGYSAPWSAKYSEAILDFAGTIQGGSIEKSIHIGPLPNAADATAAKDVEDSIYNSTLNLSISTTTKNALRIKQYVDGPSRGNTNPGTSSASDFSIVPVRPLFVTETWSQRNGNDVFTSSYVQSEDNTIINKYGFLSVPTADRLSNNNNLFLADGSQDIEDTHYPKDEQGTIVIIPQQNNRLSNQQIYVGGVSKSDPILAVSVNNKWYGIPLQEITFS